MLPGARAATKQRGVEGKQANKDGVVFKERPSAVCTGTFKDVTSQRSQRSQNIRTEHADRTRTPFWPLFFVNQFKQLTLGELNSYELGVFRT